jgi:transcriptional regulator with XRE-family HTH domain
MTEVSDRVRKARNDKGLSQDALARKIKRSRKTVIRYEKGKATPDAGDLKKIAEATGTDVNWLVGTEPGQKVSAQPELSDDVVLVVRHPDTGKVWWSAKLSFQVQVHERLEFVGGQDSNKVAVHVEGSREGAE